MSKQKHTEVPTETVSQPSEYMTYQEVARELGLSVGTIHRYADDPNIRLDRKYLGPRKVRFLRSQVDTFISDTRPERALR